MRKTNAGRVCGAVLGFLAMMPLSTELNAETPDSTIGLEGTIVVSPTHGGPIRAGEENSARPLANATFDVFSGGNVATSFTTDGNGHFHVALAPGKYSVVRHKPQPKIGRCGPFEVEVGTSGFSQVRWECDSGMR